MSPAEQRRGVDVNLRSRPQLLEYEAIADRIGADGARLVLDWGCGFGQVSRLLLDRGIEVSSFDYRPDESASGVQALERYPEIAAFIEAADPVALPYGDAHFDAVLSCGVLEHVSDPDASLDELHRVLRPGGTLYVYKLPNRRSYLEAIAKRIGLYYHGKLPDDRLYDLRSARAIVARHGFDVSEARLANMLPLTLSAAWAQTAAPQLFKANRALAAVPLLRLLATNVELVAKRR